MRLSTLCSLFCLGFASTALSAQENSAQPTTLRTPTSTAVSTSLPARGLSMAAVEQHFGTPVRKQAAIGDPPISRWIYPGYVVYFEYTHVIQAVASRN